MIQMPQSDTLTTSTMSRVFSNTAATYKFYWLFSLLDKHVKEQKAEMAALDVASRMVHEDKRFRNEVKKLLGDLPNPKGGAKSMIQSKKKY